MLLNSSELVDLMGAVKFIWTIGFWVNNKVTKIVLELTIERALVLFTVTLTLV